MKYNKYNPWRYGDKLFLYDKYHIEGDTYIYPYRKPITIKDEDSYIVVDVETTGLMPLVDDIIEISALKYEFGTLVDEFTTLIKPRYSFSITDKTIKINGITNEMVENSPTFDEIAFDLYDFIGDSTLVGYNVEFDANFLYTHFERNELILSNELVDVLALSRIRDITLPNHKLATAAKYHQLSTPDHRARNDAEVCKRYYRLLIDEINFEYGTFYDFLDTYPTMMIPNENTVNSVDTNEQQKPVSSQFDTAHFLKFIILLTIFGLIVMVIILSIIT